MSRHAPHRWKAEFEMGSSFYIHSGTTQIYFHVVCLECGATAMLARNDPWTVEKLNATPEAFALLPVGCETQQEREASERFHRSQVYIKHGPYGPNPK